jgi:hypothetical protein
MHTTISNSPNNNRLMSTHSQAWVSNHTWAHQPWDNPTWDNPWVNRTWASQTCMPIKMLQGTRRLLKLWRRRKLKLKLKRKLHMHKDWPRPKRAMEVMRLNMGKAGDSDSVCLLVYQILYKYVVAIS